MPPPNREILILKNVMRESLISQRDLAKRTGLSLGLINFLVKNFIRKGWIKISHLNKKRVKYQLTPAGFLLVAHNQHKETVNTILTYRAIRENLSKLIKDLYQKGFEHFSIHGDGVLKDLVKTTFEECLENAGARLSEIHREEPNAVILNVTADAAPNQVKGNIVNILERLEERTVQ